MPILIVEDDELIAQAIAASLQKLTPRCDFARSGAQAWDMLQNGAWNLLVLDIGLPGMSGLDVLQRLRKQDPLLPVLLLTARDGLDDRVHGLNRGADDYLVKPFEPRELEARAHALLRRSRAHKTHVLTHEGLQLDLDAQRAFVHERALDLSAREWHLLRLFVERSGHILDKDTLIDALCGQDEAITQNAIEVYVSRLRGKLDGTGLQLRTVRGLGYLLEKTHAK
jgi:DNA-binding response OmpR family regulator